MVAQDFAGFEFAAGEVRGTRAWKVDNKGRLTGVVHKKVWRPGENTAVCLREVAIPASAVNSAQLCPCGCRTPTSVIGGSGNGGALASGGYVSANTFRSLMARPAYSEEVWEHRPCSGMETKCGCGFYGYMEGSNDYFDPSNGGIKGVVGGVIRGYGKCILGDRGFRAEKAEILALYMGEFATIPNIALQMKIERNYSGVPMFESYKEMLKAFPPDLPEPGDDFWDVA